MGRVASAVVQGLQPLTAASLPALLTCAAALLGLFFLGRRSSELLRFLGLLIVASAWAAVCRAHPVPTAWMPIARLLELRASSCALAALSPAVVQQWMVGRSGSGGAIASMTLRHVSRESPRVGEGTDGTH